MEQDTADDAMRRYFFHIRHNGETVMDEEGDEFASIDEARSSALRSVRELVAARIKNGQTVINKHMDVHDETGERLMSISFREVIDAQWEN